MSVIITTQYANKIRCRYDNRFSAQYYYLKEQLDGLSKRGEQIFSIEEVSSTIDSGSYIDTYVNSGLRYLRVGDMKKYIVDMSDSVFISKEKAKLKMILQKGDVCFARTQATFDKLGNFTLIDELNESETISQHLSKIHPTKHVSSEYLCAYLNSKFGKRQMCIASYGDTRVELTHNQTKEIKVILLDKITMETIENKVKQLLLCNRNAYQAFREAQEIINTEFYGRTFKGDLTTTTKDLLIENNLWSPSCYNPTYIQTINRIKNGFRYEKLDDLVLPIKKGVEVGSENYLIEMEKSVDDIPFIRTSDIYNHEIDYAPDYYVSTQIARKNKCPDLRSGDIIFSKDGKVGEVGIINLDNSIVPSSGFAVLRSKGEISSNYLFAVLSHKEIIKNQAKMKTVIAATIPHLKIEKIKDFYVPIFDDDKVKKIDDDISIFRKNIIEKQNYIQEIEKILNTYYDKLFS